MDTHKITFTYHLRPIDHLDFSKLTGDEIDAMVDEYMGEEFRTEYPKDKYPCVDIKQGNHFDHMRKYTFVTFEFGLNVDDGEAFMFCITH
jgi:hypothetical protein